MRRLFTLCALLALPLLIPGHDGATRARADMMIASAPPSQTDLFYRGPDRAFAFSQYDFSGVGNTNGQGPTSYGGQWGTMINSAFFLSATHFHPNPGADLTFANAAGQTYTGFVAGGQEVGTTDLWVGWLSKPIPASAGIAHYAVVPDQSTDAGTSWASGRSVIAVGAPYRVGVGTLWLAYGGTLNMDSWHFDPTGKDPFSSYIVPGDSGAPTFIPVGGSLALLGTHSSDGGPYLPGTTQQYGSSDTYAPGLVAEINGVIFGQGSLDLVSIAGGLDITGVAPIPEPSAMALLGIGLATTAAVRYRRRRPAA